MVFRLYDLLYKYALIFIIFGLNCTHSLAQELYLLHEPASTIGKNTLGIRMFSETYKEWNQIRNMSYLRLMYGINSKLNIYATGIVSNHHGKKFPEEYPFHNTPERGATYPYKFNGVHLYTKYRFLTIDKKNQHLRFAAYLEGTMVKTTHHESESNLSMGDTKGIGGGIITTYLLHKFAISGSLGYIIPFDQIGYSPDPTMAIKDTKVKTKYGNTWSYSLSMGYLLFPKIYKNYKQTNINLYVELHGKKFSDANITLHLDDELEYELSRHRYPAALQQGGYLDISPGLQFIIHSNLRIDFCTTFPLLGKSWARLYPVYTVALQYYFYL
jgi:hypothetical protein